MFAAGFVGGALWAAIPVLLKVASASTSDLHAHVQLRGRGIHELSRRRAVKGGTKHGYPYTDDLSKKLMLDLLREAGSITRP
jgi:hypothetical protein